MNLKEKQEKWVENFSKLQLTDLELLINQALLRSYYWNKPSTKDLSGFFIKLGKFFKAIRLLRRNVWGEALVPFEMKYFLTGSFFKRHSSADLKLFRNKLKSLLDDIKFIKRLYY